VSAPAARLRVLSLGAGVQSTRLLLGILAGEFEPVDAAVFADTGWERKATYAHLWRLAAHTAGRIPVYVVAKGNLRADALDPAHRFASMPLHVRNPDGAKGMIRRQCTSEYKVTMIRRQTRRLWDAAGRPPVEQWQGITADEAARMRTSDVAYITNRYPLVEARETRWDCERWNVAHGWPDVPKSACTGCPFHADRQWRELRDTAPDEWADAVAFDRAIRAGHIQQGGKAQLLGQAFLHPSLVPLDQADLSTPEDHGQLNLFVNECEGLCGL